MEGRARARAPRGEPAGANEKARISAPRTNASSRFPRNKCARGPNRLISGSKDDRVHFNHVLSLSLSLSFLFPSTSRLSLPLHFRRKATPKSFVQREPRNRFPAFLDRRQDVRGARVLCRALSSRLEEISPSAKIYRRIREKCAL